MREQIAYPIEIDEVLRVFTKLSTMDTETAAYQEELLSLREAARRIDRVLGNISIALDSSVLSANWIYYLAKLPGVHVPESLPPRQVDRE